MKKTCICTLFLILVNMVSAQNSDECLDYMSDDMYLRYTASGYQNVINGNHSKAINESRKMANLSAQSELSKMINSMVTRLAVKLSEEGNDYYKELNIDTTLVSSYKVFKGMRTICQSETKLINGVYVTHVTKEISIDNISDMLEFNNEEEKKEFKKLIVK